MTAVSPFDGANRIRFKGSLVIADLRLPIGNVSDSQRWSTGDLGSPETILFSMRLPNSRTDAE